MSTRLYLHSPLPPFPRLAGPIAPNSVSRSYGLSESSSADIEVSLGDIEIAWLFPGMCWVIEEDSIGEPLWAGFSSPMEVPYKAETIPVHLIGPKEALLAEELAVRLAVPVTRGFAVRQVLIAAQEMNLGMFEGEIDQEGPAVVIDVRGETIGDFIDTVADASAGAYWRERVLIDGNELRFVLDFGELRHPSPIILGPNDIVAGHYIRERVISSVTVLGQGAGFADRQAVSTMGNVSRAASQPADGTFHPSPQPLHDLLAARDIGPASSKHYVEINERFGDNKLADYAAERHLELLNNVDELFLTLDATKDNGRAVQLGDVVTVNVPNWVEGLDILAQIHVRNIAPNAADGTREIVAGILL